MNHFADIDRRIERLCSRANGRPVGSEEIRDVLAEGYLAALQADARCRRLAEVTECLVGAPGFCASSKLYRLVEERRTLEDATCRFRHRLTLLARAVQTSPQRTA